MQDFFQTRKFLGKKTYYSLLELEKRGIGPISRLPVSIRIILESLLRNVDGKKVHKEDVEKLCRWDPEKPASGDVPFIVSRVLLQDFTGVPLLVDLAAMRDAMAKLHKDPKKIEPKVPVHLVVDHSVQVDRAGTDDAFLYNLQTEFSRNQERYAFLKWGQEAFESFEVIPPGIGIVHQVNLEHLAQVVLEKDNTLFLDTLVGTDSHTTMINGLGIVGWGVGGIEAEAAMLGESVALQTPSVVGFHLEGKLPPHVTATDLTLHITQVLRKEGVVGKFVEFFGKGAASLSVADRATIANMAPEYGATMGFFPFDEKSLDYLRKTGRDPKHLSLVEEYLRAQNLFGMPQKGELLYSKTLHLDLSTIVPSIAGPKRPQDRIALSDVAKTFASWLQKPTTEGGYGKSKKSDPICLAPQNTHPPGSKTGGTQNGAGGKLAWNEAEMVTNRPFTPPAGSPGYTDKRHYHGELQDGSIVIAAITSCTNTSNPSVMLGAGLLAKKALEKGLQVNPLVKTSLAPGSRVVTDYLHKTKLDQALDALGFQLVAYGCTTCIGNSGPLDAHIENAIQEHNIVAASVLSGNRNFEARIHGSVKANFLMSPPLVVAFALAGRIDIDLTKEPLGTGRDGKPVYLKDIWPSTEEIESLQNSSLDGSLFQNRYKNILQDNPLWGKIGAKPSSQFPWDPKSTYIKSPPYFNSFSTQLPTTTSLSNLRALALFGDSVTTDHISPAGGFKATTPAGEYLLSHGVAEKDFNSYGSRRGNHEVMLRGTFANVRIVNALAGGKEGGWTKLLPEKTPLTIFAAAEEYQKRKVPLLLFAGKDYGMGSSRDWAAKGTALLGVKAVIAESFERIHRSNLLGMGVLPLLFLPGQSWKSSHITGEELFSLEGMEHSMKPQQSVFLILDGKRKIELRLAIDTPLEMEYYLHGGIMPYVLRQQLEPHMG